MNKRRFRGRNSQKQRLTIRTILAGAIIGAALFMGVGVFVINIFDNERSEAGSNPMVVTRIQVFQDTTAVMRGSVLQVMLGINIRATGQTNKLNLTSIEFATRGSSKNAGLLLENARLWTTSNVPDFSPSRQLGPTLGTIPAEHFSLPVEHTLQDGDNYFWLTADIGKSPEGKNLVVDAECIAVFIGTLRHDPDISAPPGSRKVLNNIPYFSSGNGDISSLKSWNSTRDGSGKHPSSFSTTEAVFNIQPGHVLTNNLDGCLPALVIERSGTLVSTSDLRANFLEIKGGATFIQQQRMKNPTALSRLVIRNGGNYIHHNNGPIPARVKTLEPGSVITLQAYSQETFSQPLTWGNLVVNAANAVITDCGNALQNIRGDLEIRSTGDAYLFTSSGDSIIVGGNMLINGGRMVLSSKSNHVTLKVNKRLILKNGWLSDKIPGGDSRGSATLVLEKRVDLLSGVFKFSSPNSLIKIASSVTWNQVSAEVIIPDTEISPGASLTLSGNTMGPVAKESKITVRKNGKINCGNTVITGPGAFILDEYATLSSGSKDGINTDGMRGSIQTNTRVFSSHANYIYTGNATPQMSGVFETRPVENTINNLVIEKENYGDIVILEQNLKLHGRLVKERGSLNKNAFNLQVGGTITETASVTP